MKLYPKIPYSFCGECRFSNICPTLHDSYEDILEQIRSELLLRFDEIMADKHLSASERYEKFDRILNILSYYDAQEKNRHEWE